MSQVPDFEAGFEQSMKLIDSWSRRAQEQVERAESLQQAVGAVRVSRWSPGREVCVTLNSSGLLADIQFSDRSRTRSAAALSRDVLTAMRGALDDLQARVTEIAVDGSSSGPDSIAESLIGSYDRSLSSPLTQFRPGDDPRQNSTIR